MHIGTKGFCGGGNSNLHFQQGIKFSLSLFLPAGHMNARKTIFRFEHKTLTVEAVTPLWMVLLLRIHWGCHWARGKLTWLWKCYYTRGWIYATTRMRHPFMLCNTSLPMRIKTATVFPPVKNGLCLTCFPVGWESGLRFQNLICVERERGDRSQR